MNGARPISNPASGVWVVVELTLAKHLAVTAVALQGRELCIQLIAYADLLVERKSQRQQQHQL